MNASRVQFMLVVGTTPDGTTDPETDSVRVELKDPVGAVGILCSSQAGPYAYLKPGDLVRVVQMHSEGQEPVFVIDDDDDYAARTTDGDTVMSDTDVDTEWEMEEEPSLREACSLIS